MGGNGYAHVKGVNDPSALVLALSRDLGGVQSTLPLKKGDERAGAGEGGGNRCKSTVNKGPFCDRNSYSPWPASTAMERTASAYIVEGGGLGGGVKGRRGWTSNETWGFQNPSQWAYIFLINYAEREN